MIPITKCLIFVLIFNVCVADDYVINDKRFPDDFMFGTATASYQVEGAWNEDGKTQNMWDNVTHRQPDFIIDRSNGDVACDSYHKYKEDVAMLKTLGVTHYRFSLAWNRILPNGIADTVNEAGVAYYKNLIKELQNNNIVPLVTIHHWDLPQVLLDQGGFLNESIIDWFGDYARVCFESFGDDVKFWLTFNEPKQVCTGGYAYAYEPPQVRSEGLLELVCIHNLVRAHAKGWHIYDDEFRSKQQGKVGITLDSVAFVPDSESAEDKEATDRAYHFELGVYANPIYHGDYPEVVKTRIAERSKLEGREKSRLPEFTEEEKAWVKGTHDYFGLNVYTGNLVQNIPEPAITNPPSKYGDTGVNSYQPSTWETTVSDYFKVVPWTVRYLLRWVKEQYNDPDIIITENGYPDSGGVSDEKRLSYVTAYLSNIRDAMLEDNVKVFGYTLWSLMDNFEWASGYSIKYGIYQVDFNSPNRTRTPKLSSEYFTKFGVYANPIYHGDYPEVVKTRIANRSKLEGREKSRLPEFTEDEKHWVKGTHDFFGLNVYSGVLVENIPEPDITDPPSRHGDQGINTYQPDTWESTAVVNVKVVPWSIRYELKWIKDHYNDPDIILTENGYPDHGDLSDGKRLSIIRAYLSHIRDAMLEDNVKVFGYTVWSLLDNFEWARGYSVKYGLYHVDFNSPNRTRTAKDSVEYYSKVCHTGCLVDTCSD